MPAVHTCVVYAVWIDIPVTDTLHASSHWNNAAAKHHLRANAPYHFFLHLQAPNEQQWNAYIQRYSICKRQPTNQYTYTQKQSA